MFFDASWPTAEPLLGSSHCGLDSGRMPCQQPSITTTDGTMDVVAKAGPLASFALLPVAFTECTSYCARASLAAYCSPATCIDIGGFASSMSTICTIPNRM